MPNIPEFQRERFASSLVGTPGEDRSGQIIGQAVTKAAGQIENAAFDIAVKRQKAMDDSLATRVSTDLRIAADAAAAQHDVDYANFDGAPDERSAKTRPVYEDLVTQQLAKVQSPGARRQIEAFGQELIGTYTINEAKRGRINQGVLAAKNTLATVNTLSIEAANVARNASLSPTQQFMAVQGLLQQGEAAYQSGFEAYSVDDRHKLVKQIPESISKSFLMNLVTDNPEDVKGFLESGMFDSVLDPKERKSLMDDAAAAIPKAIERRELRALQDTVSGDLDLYDKVANQDPDVLQAIAESKSPKAGVYKDMVLKGREATRDDYDTLISLVGQIGALYERDKKTGKPTHISKKTKLEDFQRVFDFATQAELTGKLKPGTVRSSVKNILEPYARALSTPERSNRAGGLVKILGEVSKFSTPLLFTNLVHKTLSGFAEKNGLGADSLGRMLQDFTERFDPTNVKSPADAAALARELTQEEAARQVPGLNLLPDAPAKAKTSGGRMLTLQPGKGDAKPQAVLTGKGVERVNQRSRDGKTLYEVTYIDGKFSGKTVVESA